jgi:hypothetical protein
MSLILTVLKADKQLNMYVVVVLSSLRLIKVEPLSKLFREKYYLVAHFFTCIMILLAFWDDDWSLNWLRRCPVP